MAVKLGYMQTEVGVIPDEWVVKPLKEVGRFSKGKGLLKEDIKTSGRIPAIPYTALYTDFSELLNYDHIKWFIDDETQTYIASEPCVLIASSSNMAANTGKASALTRTTPVAIGREVIVFKTASNCSYISFLLSTSPYRQKTLSLARGTTIKHLYPATFQDYKIALPPLPEQGAIVTALSDVDALQGALERLLAKKRDLKQATMQQLLTGQTRLPGFHGEWDVKTMSEVCWFQEGPGVRNTQFTASGVKLLNGSNIFRGVLSLDTTSRFISEKEAHGAYAHFLADEGDIVLASSGITIERLHEKVAYVTARDLPFCMNTSTIRFKPSAGILDPQFLFQFLTSDAFKRPIGGQATGSAQLNFGPSHVAKIDVSLPPLPEQTAIAAVLTDMDAELAALEQRLAKTRALKQGMMQELLTGRTRLV